MSLQLQNVTAVVLAGGLGTRIKSLYPDVPKPMIPVHGKPFVEWVLRYLYQQGIRRAVISSGYLADTVENHFGSNPIKGMQVKCVAEPKPLGTAGGFLHAASSLEAQQGWLVLNGDSLVLADLSLAAQLLQDPHVDSVVMGIQVPDASRYGRLRFDCSGQLLHFAEKEPGSGIVNGGIYFFKPSLLEKFPAQTPLSFEKDVFPSLLLKQVRIQVCIASAPFLDIGTPASLALGEDFIHQHLESFRTA